MGKMIELDLSITDKTPVRFSKDDNRIVYINFSDLSAVGRVTETYPKLLALCAEAAEGADIPLDDNDDEATVRAGQEFGNKLKDIDTKMRELVDYIFNAPVCAAAAPDGSMYDPFDGSFRFEYIMGLLMAQYEKSISDEFAKVDARIKTHTDKYTK